MTLLAVWLLSVGACDLLRATRDRVSSRQAWAIAVFAVLVDVGLLLTVDTSSAIPWWTAAPGAVGLLVFVVASAAALDHRRDGRRGRSRAVALTAFAASVLWLLAAGGRVLAGDGLLQRWYDRLDVPGLAAVPLPHFLLGVGLVLVQLATANVLVRMVLDGVGSPADSNEQTLKGGRLLGPMERVFILALGMAGHVTAASVVIAAKGLLRYPELQANSSRGPSGGELSEYFLVGSFLSWLIAMAGLPLL